MSENKAADLSQTLARTTKASLINRSVSCEIEQINYPTNLKRKVGYLEYNIMRELSVNEIEQVSGGIPLFVAIAVYGELASLAATISAIATYNAIRS